MRKRFSETLATLSLLASIGSFALGAWQVLPEKRATEKTHVAESFGSRTSRWFLNDITIDYATMSCVRIILVCGAGLVAIRVLRPPRTKR